jgi:hypothetical protein
MARPTSDTPREGLRTARLLMVLSSVSPLFILWAIRGTSLVPSVYFVIACATVVLVPNLVLWARLKTARRQKDKKIITVGSADDHRDHILIYLFAILLPFYSEDLGSWRFLISSIVAVGFIVFLFWHLNLHYMNLLFAAFGYRVFTVCPPVDGNMYTGRAGIALITKRASLASGDQITGYRLSDSVYLED